MRIPPRWLVALAAGWAAAGVIFVATSRLSLVLLLGPIAFILGDFGADRRKARLQAVVDQAFLELVSDDEPHFRGDSLVVLRRRSRLLGVPPRLIDVRIGRSADGSHWAVRAEVCRAVADAIRWRVTRLTEAEARTALA